MLEPEEDAAEAAAQARVISDRMVALFVERAVPAVRLGRGFQTWALDEADPEDAAHFLQGQAGAIRHCWDETVLIYQAEGAPLCEVRACPVEPTHVLDQMDHWVQATWPPYMRRPPGAEGIARDYLGPHPEGGFTNILLSFAADAEDDGVFQAHLSVAWVSEGAV